jgi:oxygen-independent coproporphyrinogen-3 oxidase
MQGTGIASFGHMSGVHIQNSASRTNYLEALHSDKLLLKGAFSINREERLVRQMI